MPVRTCPGAAFCDAFHADPGRALDGGAGSGMGADSAFEEMIRSRPVVHRPVPPAWPPARGHLARRRYRG